MAERRYNEDRFCSNMKGWNRNNSQIQDDEKLRELILYLADNSNGDESFGALNLNKHLFYADFYAYVYLG